MINFHYPSSSSVLYTTASLWPYFFSFSLENVPLYGFSSLADGEFRLLTGNRISDLKCTDGVAFLRYNIRVVPLGD